MREQHSQVSRKQRESEEMEGVNKERQKEMEEEEEGGSGGDDGHLQHNPYSLLHCLLRAFLGCFGLLQDSADPLIFPNHSPSHDTHPHDTHLTSVQEDDAAPFITTTEDVTLIQSLGVRMPRKPPANPGRGGQTN